MFYDHTQADGYIAELVQNLLLKWKLLQSSVQVFSTYLQVYRDVTNVDTLANAQYIMRIIRIIYWAYTIIKKYTAPNKTSIIV